MTGEGRRLGAIPSGPTPHLLKLERFLAAGLPAPPPSVDWTEGIYGWPVLRNDVLGDCVPAAVYHFMQAAERWRDGTARPGDNADAVACYQSLGYDPANPATDVGVRISDLMVAWHMRGFPAHGGLDKIDAFARISDMANLKLALWLFGPIVMGFLMPLSAELGSDWTAPVDLTGDNEPGSWGGHCMLLVAMGAGGDATLVSWGELVTASAGWMAAYQDEAWPVLHPVWHGAYVSPSGWGERALVANMGMISA